MVSIPYLWDMENGLLRQEGPEDITVSETAEEHNANDPEHSKNDADRSY